MTNNYHVQDCLAKLSTHEFDSTTGNYRVHSDFLPYMCEHLPQLRGLWSSTYNDLPLIRQAGVRAGYQRFLDSLDSGRLDIYLEFGGIIVGYTCIVLDWDMHCGWCFAVQWQYVRKDHYGSPLARQVFRVLKELHNQTGLPYAYSKVQSDGSVLIRYKGISIIPKEPTNG